MQKQIILKIYGRVQGVFFRASSMKEAKKLGISGVASNEDDGTVKIEAEGGEGELKQFIDWCKEGPEHAKVDRVEIKWTEATGAFSDFIVK